MLQGARQRVDEVVQRSLVARKANPSNKPINDDAALVFRDVGMRVLAEQLAEPDFAQGALLEVFEVGRLEVDFEARVLDEDVVRDGQVGSALDACWSARAVVFRGDEEVFALVRAVGVAFGEGEVVVVLD